MFRVAPQTEFCGPDLDKLQEFLPEVAARRAHLARSAHSAFEKLHPTQQDVLLRLKQYANVVSWSQVTCAAHHVDSSKDEAEQVPPWNSLERIFSPDAMLAVGVFL